MNRQGHLLARNMNCSLIDYQHNFPSSFSSTWGSIHHPPPNFRNLAATSAPIFHAPPTFEAPTILNDVNPQSGPPIENLLHAILDNDEVGFVDDVIDDDLSDIDMNEVDLLLRIWKDTKRLKKLRQKKNGCSELEHLEGSKKSWRQELARRKKFLRTHESILRLMLTVMICCRARGFVYGIIPEKGKPIGVSSINLRAWWKEEVKFDPNAVAAIRKYAAEKAQSVDNKEKVNISIPDALKEFRDTALASLLSELMPHCNPPQRAHPIGKEVPPPWWPTINEEWWEDLGFPTDKGSPPFKKPHDLKKIWKVTVITAVIKHMLPNIGKLRGIVMSSTTLQNRLTLKEMDLWGVILDQEEQALRKFQPDMPILRYADDGASWGRAGDDIIDLDTDEEEHRTEETTKSNATTATSSENNWVDLNPLGTNDNNSISYGHKRPAPVEPHQQLDSRRAQRFCGSSSTFFETQDSDNFSVLPPTYNQMISNQFGSTTMGPAEMPGFRIPNNRAFTGSILHCDDQVSPPNPGWNEPTSFFPMNNHSYNELSDVCSNWMVNHNTPEHDTTNGLSFHLPTLNAGNDCYILETEQRSDPSEQAGGQIQYTEYKMNREMQIDREIEDTERLLQIVDDPDFLNLIT